MYRIGQEEIDAVARVINSRDFFKINNSGQEVLHFEKEWGEYVGVQYALQMTSGLAALTSGLIGMGIGPGDEVIIPAYTYIATALAVTGTGAIPVIAEVDDTLTLDVEDAERKITSHTKAIIPVHIQGFPSDMDGITKLAKQYGLKVLEDACQADGGSYHGRFLGTLGDAGAYSYNYYKVITAGEGGALVTEDRVIYERALIYHDSGAVAFFGDQLEGINQPLFGGTEFRVSDITGAILREQLKRMPNIIEDLRKNKKKLMTQMGSHLLPIRSHDFEGDCGTTLALRFENQEQARRFADHCASAGIAITIPIDTGKHVYTNWSQIMERRGAFHPAMDPYQMEANRELQQNYTMDMCPRTLELLACTAYLAVSPDWSDAELAQIINTLQTF